MQDHRHLPDINRLSVITAVILLVYSLTAFIRIPEKTINLQLPGFLFTARFNLITVVAVFTAVFAASGTDWLVLHHPHIEGKLRWQHWIVPAFTALAIGIPLGTLPVSSSWWVIFFFGGLLLAGVLVCEYISVDSSDTRYPLATLILTAVTFALLLVLVASMRGSDFRLYLLMAVLVPAVLIVAARTLFLLVSEGWKLNWSFAITLIVTQIAAGLFYFRLPPLPFGLVVVGLTYGLVRLAANLEEHRLASSIWLEPVIMFSTFALLAFLVK